MDKGAWWATVPGVIKNWTGLSEDARMPAVRTRSFHSQGLGFIPGWGTIIKKHASCQAWPRKKKQHTGGKKCVQIWLSTQHIFNTLEEMTGFSINS